MSIDDDTSLLMKYHFKPWPDPTTHRPLSSISIKENRLDLLELTVENRTLSERPPKRLVHHQIRIPTCSRSSTPISFRQINSTPETNFNSEEKSIVVRKPKLVQIKSSELTILNGKNKEKNCEQNFPRQRFDQIQIKNQRKRRKQQTQSSIEFYPEIERWIDFRRSLAHLKRSAMNKSQIESDLSLVPIQNENQRTFLKSETGLQRSAMISLFSRPNCSRSRSRSTQIHSSNFNRRSNLVQTKIYVDPLAVQSKPLHPTVLTATYPSKDLMKIISDHRPTLIQNEIQRKNSVKPTIFDKTEKEEKRRITVDKDLPRRERSRPQTSNTRRDRPLNNSLKHQVKSRVRAQSTIQLSLDETVEVTTPIRCRSATDLRSNIDKNRQFPRILIIADEEHRIESWYHQMPFILADDLIKHFPLKTTQKSVLSAYFIDDFQISKTNFKAKTHLQGKTFDVHQDWLKYDLILISIENYQLIVEQLQPIIESNKSLTKPIRIFPIDHQQELKIQVKQKSRLTQTEISV